MDTLERGLAPGAVERYRRDGFLFPLPVFGRHEAAAWADLALGMAATGLPDHPAPWRQKAYLLFPTLDGLVRDPRLTDPVASVLGDDLLVLSADLFVKAPRSPGRVTWHQDVNFWRLEPLEVLTAWVAFTPSTRTNGCVRYAPGRHGDRVVHVERPTADNMLNRGQELAVTVDEGAVVDVGLAPGEVSFHHALTPHASGANRADAPRIGFAIRYAPCAVAQAGGPPISARLARGTDRHGHFRLESGPDHALSPAARAEHHRALAPHEATAYSTV